MNDELDSIMKTLTGQHATKEIRDGVYEWTFTPRTSQPEPLTPGSIIQALEKAGYKLVHGVWFSPGALAQISPKPTADELWEQWRKRDKTSMLARLEELNQPTTFGSAWQYIARYPNPTNAPSLLRPRPASTLASTGTFDLDLSLMDQLLYPTERDYPSMDDLRDAGFNLMAGDIQQGINRIMNDNSYHKAQRRYKQARIDRKRIRRQHRAAFRRRKRGLV